MLLYNVNMDILKKIDDIRIANGWSVYRLAEICDITPSTLANMFARGTLPSITTLMSICQGCGISMAEFFSEDEYNLESYEEKELVCSFRKLSDKNKKAVKQLIKNVS